METLPSSNIQRDVRPFCSKENTCALSELRGLIEALRELFINHEDFSLLVTTVSSKSVHRCFLEKREERENTLPSMVDVVYNVDFLSTIFSHPAQEVFLLREERSTVKNVDKKREKRRGWFYSRDVLFYASVFTIKSLVGKKKKKRKRKKKEENEKCFENLTGIMKNVSLPFLLSAINFDSFFFLFSSNKTAYIQVSVHTPFLCREAITINETVKIALSVTL